MTPRSEYRRRAEEAYANYMQAQSQVSTIEARALVAYGGNKGLRANRLQHGEQYWKYRDLCDDRDMYMKIAQLNAAMAALPPLTGLDAIRHPSCTDTLCDRAEPHTHE